MNNLKTNFYFLKCLLLSSFQFVGASALNNSTHDQVDNSNLVLPTVTSSVRFRKSSTFHQKGNPKTVRRVIGVYEPYDYYINKTKVISLIPHRGLAITKEVFQQKGNVGPVWWVTNAKRLLIAPNCSIEEFVRLPKEYQKNMLHEEKQYIYLGPRRLQGGDWLYQEIEELKNRVKQYMHETLQLNGYGVIRESISDEEIDDMAKTAICFTLEKIITHSERPIDWKKRSFWQGKSCEKRVNALLEEIKKPLGEALQKLLDPGTDIQNMIQKDSGQMERFNKALKHVTNQYNKKKYGKNTLSFLGVYYGFIKRGPVPRIMKSSFKGGIKVGKGFSKNSKELQMEGIYDFGDVVKCGILLTPYLLKKLPTFLERKDHHIGEEDVVVPPGEIEYEELVYEVEVPPSFENSDREGDSFYSRRNRGNNFNGVLSSIQKNYPSASLYPDKPRKTKKVYVKVPKKKPSKKVDESAKDEARKEANIVDQGVEETFRRIGKNMAGYTGGQLFQFIGEIKGYSKARKYLLGAAGITVGRTCDDMASQGISKVFKGKCLTLTNIGGNVMAGIMGIVVEKKGQKIAKKFKKENQEKVEGVLGLVGSIVGQEVGEALFKLLFSSII